MLFLANKIHVPRDYKVHNLENHSKIRDKVRSRQEEILQVQRGIQPGV